MEFWVVAVAFLLLGIPLAVLGARWQTGKWAALAEALGFQLLGPVPGFGGWGDMRPLQGAHGRFTVQVRTFTTGSGKNETRWTSLEVPVLAADPLFTMRLSREGVLSKLAQAFGGQDVKLGDEAFDGAFRIQGSDEARVRAALGFGVRPGLLALPRGEVRVEPGMQLTDGAWHAAGAEDLVRTVRVLRAAAPLPSDLEQAVASQTRQGNPVALVRFTRQGVWTDAEAIREALPALVRLAEAVEAAAPRPA